MSEPSPLPSITAAELEALKAHLERIHDIAYMCGWPKKTMSLESWLWERLGKDLPWKNFAPIEKEPGA